MHSNLLKFCVCSNVKIMKCVFVNTHQQSCHSRSIRYLLHWKKMFGSKWKVTISDYANERFKIGCQKFVESTMESTMYSLQTWQKSNLFFYPKVQHCGYNMIPVSSGIWNINIKIFFFATSFVVINSFSSNLGYSRIENDHQASNRLDHQWVL